MSSQGPDRTYQAAVGRRLADYRVRHGWSLTEVQRETGLQASAIGMWERGERNMRVEDLAALAAAYGVPVAQFLPEKAGAWWAL